MSVRNVVFSYVSYLCERSDIIFSVSIKIYRLKKKNLLFFLLSIFSEIKSEFEVSRMSFFFLRIPQVDSEHDPF